MLILVFLIGFLVISGISTRVALTERVGFALPVGLCAVTVMMALMDWVGIALSAAHLAVLTILLLVATAIPLWKNRRAFVRSLRPRKTNWRWLNLLWALALLAVIYLEAVNFSKCLIYPTYDRDSMAAFDTFGYVCAQEQTYHLMSIFDPSYMPSLHREGSAITYMPMLQMSYAYVYAFGASTSKAVPAWLYLTFLIGMYGLCRRRMTRTLSVIVLLGIMLTPEMTSFASLSTTNVIHACIAAPAAIYICLWMRNNRRRDLLMGSLLLLCAQWMRAESVVFTLTALLLVAIHVWRTRRRALSPNKTAAARISYTALLWPAAALLPLLLWQTYIHTCGLSVPGSIITPPFFDGDKFLSILQGVWILLSAGDYYGWTFHFALLAVIVSIYFYAHKKDSPTLPVFLIISLVLYILVIYHIRFVWDSLQNVLAYSVKRFLFCFVPMAWYIVGNTRPLRRLMWWIERTCGLSARK